MRFFIVSRALYNDHFDTLSEAHQEAATLSERSGCTWYVLEAVEKIDAITTTTSKTTRL